MPKQNYSEKEVAQIIKRAAELESRQTDRFESIESSPGLSLDELSQIAIEAGLDPENVRRAADELSHSPQSGLQSGAAQDNEIISEVWVEGEFTDKLADLVIADLNHRYNTTHEKPNWKDNILNDATVDPEKQSIVRRTGDSLEWKKLNRKGIEEMRVLIQPRKDRIRIRVAKQGTQKNGVSDLKGATEYLSYVPYMAGIIMLMALPNSFWFNAIIAILTFAALQFGVSKAKSIMKSQGSPPGKPLTNSYQNEVEAMARDLAELIGHPVKDEGTINIESRSENTDSQTSTQNRSRDRS